MAAAHTDFPNLRIWKSPIWEEWMYCVNDWYPNYGCGQYVVKNGDVIEWNYTCDLGKDLGQDWMGEDWTETHE